MNDELETEEILYRSKLLIASDLLYALPCILLGGVGSFLIIKYSLGIIILVGALFFLLCGCLIIVLSKQIIVTNFCIKESKPFLFQLKIFSLKKIKKVKESDYKFIVKSRFGTPRLLHHGKQFEIEFKDDEKFNFNTFETKDYQQIVDAIERATKKTIH
ncbi:MAG: hypothetical protein RIQ33_1930 [Bacteroidota bacterium]|jgi:hypothetical protein